MESAPFSTTARTLIQQAKIFQKRAEEDEAAGEISSAIQAYIQSGDYYLQAAKAEERNSNAKVVLKKYADYALGKAEVLKGIPTKSSAVAPSFRKQGSGQSQAVQSVQSVQSVQPLQPAPSPAKEVPVSPPTQSPPPQAKDLPTPKKDSPVQKPSPQVTRPADLSTTTTDQGLDDQVDESNPAYKSDPPQYKAIAPPVQPDVSAGNLDLAIGNLNLDDGLLEVDFAELKPHFGQLLGEGSFGSVFKCKWQGLPVAVKVIKFGMSLPEEELRVFKLEVELLKSLRHPNIVQFLGASLHPPNLAIITELLSGNLWDLIHNRKYKADLSSALHMARDVARGLAFLHSKKVIHRDIKSGNVLIDGPGGRLKLVDFGLARTKAAASKAVMTRAGTRFWMAPEIMLGKAYDEAVDIYSFAVLLYEIASCQIPYYGMDEFAVIQEVAYKGYRLPIPATVHPILRKLIQASWNQDADARPKAVRIIDYIDKKLGDA